MEACSLIDVAFFLILLTVFCVFLVSAGPEILRLFKKPDATVEGAPTKKYCVGDDSEYEWPINLADLNDEEKEYYARHPDMNDWRNGNVTVPATVECVRGGVDREKRDKIREALRNEARDVFVLVNELIALSADEGLVLRLIEMSRTLRFADEHGFAYNNPDHLSRLVGAARMLCRKANRFGS